jgi:hypothetical protein
VSFFLFYSLLGGLKYSHLPRCFNNMICVQLISMIVHFARWYQLAAWMRNFSLYSTAMCLCIILLPTLESLYVIEVSIGQSCQLWPISFPLNSNWELSTLHLICRCWFIVPKSYLDSSRWKPWQFYRFERVLSEVVFWYNTFFLNSLKVDSIVLSHFNASYHMHHECIIT